MEIHLACLVLFLNKKRKYEVFSIYIGSLFAELGDVEALYPAAYDPSAFRPQRILTRTYYW